MYCLGLLIPKLALLKDSSLCRDAMIALFKRGKVNSILQCSEMNRLHGALSRGSVKSLVLVQLEWKA